MSEIPANPVTPADLARWYGIQREVSKLKAEEALLRSKIFKGYFPTPVEGTNKTPLNDGTGAELKATHVLNRKVDEGALDALRQSMQPTDLGDGTFLEPNVPKLPLDKLVKWKPEVAISEYRKLTAEEQLLFDQCLIITIGSPQVEITIPKKAKA
jgi:hypothetical protein